MEFTFLDIAIGVYLAFAFAKTMLCLPNIGTAIRVMSRLHGAEKGSVKMKYVITIPITVVGVGFVMWIPALVNEGFKFFVMYSRFTISRDIVRAYRAANPND